MQKAEAKKSEIPSAWQLLTATMSRADAQTLLPISPGQLKKSIFGKVTNARGDGSSRLSNRLNGYPKPLDFTRGCAVVGNSGILLKPLGHNKKPLGPFIDAHLRWAAASARWRRAHLDHSQWHCILRAML